MCPATAAATGLPCVEKPKCEAWCNHYTCGNKKQCGGCGYHFCPDPNEHVCQDWCNLHTCGAGKCRDCGEGDGLNMNGESRDCASKMDGTYCADWCSEFTCGNKKMCGGCSDCTDACDCTGNKGKAEQQSYYVNEMGDFCDTWDAMHDYCQAGGTSFGASWCDEPWCYTPSHCSGAVAGGYFAAQEGPQLYYNYEKCDGTDSYTGTV